MLLAIDQGTTGTTCLVFDADGELAGRAYREFEQHFPQPGWVEHDPEELWTSVLAAAQAAVASARISAEELRGIVKRECHAEDLDVPQIAVEPGRAIAGPAGITLYTVGTLKDVPLGGSSARRYVSVDGGMSDNIRTALYDAVYDCRLVSRSSERDGSGDAVLSRVVGKHCESGDVVVRDCWLPADLAPGDLLAVAATGAYCYSMASSYNRLPRPAVVAVRDGQARALLRRETLEDQFRLEVAP